LGKKVLITYASGFGTTQEIAEFIGKVLTEKGIEVALAPASDVTDITAYDGVILGASIRAGNLLPAALNFASKFKYALAKIPVAAFVVCLTMQEDTEENRQIVSCWLNPLRELVTPFDTGYFAGQLVYKQLPFSNQLLAQLMKQPEGDYRDRDKIRAWALGLVPVLTGESCPVPKDGKKPVC
jgi:menaquinone-dependent protoporphyrinogen oxidase